MPQNDHDYHNINAMHVHTKNDQDFDSAILHYCMFFANHSLMVVGIGFKLGEHDDSTFRHPPVTVQWQKTASSRHNTDSCQQLLGLAT